MNTQPAVADTFSSSSWMFMFAGGKNANGAELSARSEGSHSTMQGISVAAHMSLTSEYTEVDNSHTAAAYGTDLNHAAMDFFIPGFS